MTATALLKRRAKSDPPLPATFYVHRFSVEDYHRMIAAGILTSDHRVELLNGWIVDQMPQNPPHSSSVRKVSRFFSEILPENWFVSAQLPITLANSEPEPDIAIVQGTEDDFVSRHPESGDIGLLIEIADDSLKKDRGEKALIYAEARIAEYWIVNLVDSVVEVFSKPQNGRRPKYRQHKVYRPGDMISLVLGGKKIAQVAVRDLLP
ncbi:MAG: Uma2 family endonuclease [Gemmataceae bacterium]|nr:Uma2 family endonuclease [Gemmataceae bacterium]MCI0740495.1 Uma2 family endonuclease [Gemmataceae bacterium]